MVSQMQEERDRQFMELALEQARLALERGQMPFGAVVVDRDGQVLGVGHNTVLADFDPTAHGEVVAIREAWRQVGDAEKLRGATVYTSCEPCLMCSFVIARMGLGRVVYAARGMDVSTYRPLLDATLSSVAAWLETQPDREPIEVVGDFMREEGREVLRQYPWEGRD